MRIGVTGSSGLIGSALVRALRDRGDDVITFVRPGSTASGPSSIRWDPAREMIDADDLARVGGFDAVVHLAGAGIADRRWTETRRREIRDSRVRSTALLVNALRDLPAGVRVLASGSAIGIYGSRAEEVLREDSSLGHDFLADVCRDWEAEALQLETSGSRVAVLRTGIVLSATGGALRRQLPLFRLGLGGRLGSGRQWMSPISLADEVRAIIWTIDGDLRGPLNLTGPQPLTNAEFTRTLAARVHRPAPFAVLAVALGLALGRDVAEGVVLASQRVVPTRLVESGFTFQHPTADAMIASALVRT